jgi:MoxR-like ATPase
MPNNTPPSKDLIRSLGILGWAELEPTIIASLALEYPLLLIGPHGTAKSLLLERLAEALNLNFRHYNASTLNFDDLVGFPVPDGDRVRYLRTPLDAWNAEAIFIDEISRCRIDMQNRLFPLVHECRLQGQKLTQLRYRWAAMNPPPTGEEDVHHQYIGTEALDPAFADRFPWIIHVPTDLRGTDLIALIRGPKCDPDAGERLISEVQKVRSRLKTTEEIFGEKVAAYIQYLFPLLQPTNSLPLSQHTCSYRYPALRKPKRSRHDCTAKFASTSMLAKGLGSSDCQDLSFCRAMPRRRYK